MIGAHVACQKASLTFPPAATRACARVASQTFTSQECPRLLMELTPRNWDTNSSAGEGALDLELPEWTTTVTPVPCRAIKTYLVCEKTSMLLECTASSTWAACFAPAHACADMTPWMCAY